ncbi:DUF58 domain-containing protein [Mycobacterium sp.]|uniref:DUF58 domain-containing protein n=1 Tax=Mycobacterium sp. TaxID=1785 RepID=UPI003C731D59
MTEARSGGARRTEVEFRWAASSLTRSIATCAAVGLAAAVIGSRWQLIAFVAPLIGVLSSIPWQRSAAKVYVHAKPGMVRCFEDEQVQTTAWVTTESADTAAQLEVTVPEGMDTELLDGGSAQSKTLAAQAARWGRYPLSATVDAVCAGGLLGARATVEAAEIFVFPVVPPQSTGIPRTELPDRLGTHLTRHIGPGVEYADVRAYLPGDQLRTVNWPVSARRGSLHVTERLTDRAADVVVLIDTSAQAAGPATEATERAVRGAVQVVQTALRNGDRAGVVALGGRRPRWLGADIGRRQFYRVLDAVLGAGGEFEVTTGTLAPRAAVPAGAIIVAFSTLLDTEFALSLIDLRKRGHTVVAVDVLRGAPFETEQDPIITRMWALQRSAMYRDMGVIGVNVVSWPEDVTLDQSMRLVPDHLHGAGRR